MARKKRKSRGNRAAPASQKGRGRWFPTVALILAAALIGIGGGWLLARQRNTGPTVAEIQLASISQLSEKVRSAPPVVQEAYRFAIANPDILKRISCYCGCGSMGHTSNLDCFIQDLNPGGAIVFDYHALG